MKNRKKPASKAPVRPGPHCSPALLELEKLLVQASGLEGLPWKTITVKIGWGACPTIQAELFMNETDLAAAMQPLSPDH